MGGRGKGSAGTQIAGGSAKAGSEIQAKTVNTKSDNASAGVIIFMMVVLLRQATSHASNLPHLKIGQCDMDHKPLIFLNFQKASLAATT